MSYFGLGRPGRLPGDIIDQSNWNLEKVRNGNSLPALFDPNFKYGLLTPNIERALSLQRIWKFGLLAPYNATRTKNYFKETHIRNGTTRVLCCIAATEIEAFGDPCAVCTHALKYLLAPTPPTHPIARFTRDDRRANLEFAKPSPLY